MNYYASYQRSSVPKWAVVTLGGVFTLIIMVCAIMIVHLLRPINRVPLPIVASTVAQPKLAAKASTPETAAIPQSSPVAALVPALATAPVREPAALNARAVKAHSKHAHKRAVLAKRDGKASRSAKTDIDRLLGL